MKLCRAFGFTIMEILTTIAIIGILAAMVLPRYYMQTEKGIAAEAMRTIEAVSAGEKSYFNVNEKYMSAVFDSCSINRDNDFLILGLENPGKRPNRRFNISVYLPTPLPTPPAVPTEYCIVATRCGSTSPGNNIPALPSGCNADCAEASSSNEFLGTTICVDQSGNLSGTNKAGPGYKRTPSAVCDDYNCG